MNWRFWERAAKEGDDCTVIEPLLSLYSDGMASPAESRRIEAHLQGCADCRQTLSWMQATRQVIAARPAVPPPADLRARIARAIAEAEGGVSAPALPVIVRPARRPLALRPALAFGLSAAVVAALAGGLFWSDHQGHGGIQQASNNIFKPTPNAVPPVSVRPPTSSFPLDRERPHPDLPHTVVAALPHPRAPHVVMRHPLVRVQPPSERMAVLPTERSQDNPPDVAVPDTPVRTRVTVPVPHLKPVIVKRPADQFHMATTNIPRERPSAPIVRTPTAPAPANSDVVATNAGVSPSRSVIIPDVPHPVNVTIKPFVIHPDHPDGADTDVHVARHEDTTTDVLKGFAMRMRSVDLNRTSHSYALRGIVAAGANMASDSSGTLPITSGPLH